MKKIIALLLALVLVFGLVACGSTAETTESAGEGQQNVDEGRLEKFASPEWDGSLPLVQEDNLLRGPGVYDMKYGIVAGIWALLALQHTGGLPGIYTKHHRGEFEKELLDGVTILD